MEAILVVGGLGTRLRPLTDDLPKSLLPVAGTPIVVHQIARARNSGVEHVVLATSYRAELFAAALGDGSQLGVTVHYAVEDEPLGSAGAIRNAASLLAAGADEPVLVFNGDIIDDHDITAQVQQHVATGADATLYLTKVRDARAFGCVPTDPDGRVTAFLEKMDSPVTNQINAGCYVFRRAIIDAIPTGRAVSVERETFPELLDSGSVVQGYVDDSYWRDLGTPESYVRGSADAVLGLVDAPVRPGPAGEFLVLDASEVSPSAILRSGTSVGPGCMIGPDAVIECSVVLDGAVIGARATVRNCAIGRGARIGSGAVLDGVVLAAGVELPDDARPAPGSRLQ
ncbi:MAG TPA: NDP-sugar synthase [Jiangellaceae bacterium]|nr:NDP-sugar synthase [Jiangellaceae bacterium]